MLIILLLLPSLLGSLSSVATVLLAFPLLPAVVSVEAWRSLRDEPVIWVFPATFAALLFSFAVTARHPSDLLYGANFLAFLLAVAVFVIARRHAGRGMTLLIAALCAVGAVIAALVAANDVFLRGVARATGFLMGGNLLARIALLLGFFALSGLFVTRSHWRFALYLGPLAGLAVMLLTGTRGAALAVPAFFLILAGVLMFDRRDRWQVAALALLCAAVIAAVSLSGRFAGIAQVVADVITSGASASDASTNERLAMLYGAIEAFKLSPWVGYGWADLSSAAALGMDMTPYGGSASDGFQFHSDFANFAVAAGLVGLGSWLALLAAPLVGVLLSPRDTLFRSRLYAALILSLGYAILGITDLNFGYDLPTTLFAFLTAAVFGAFRETPPNLSGSDISSRN